MIAYKIGMRDGIGSLKDKVGSKATVLTTVALLQSIKFYFDLKPETPDTDGQYHYRSTPYDGYSG